MKLFTLIDQKRIFVVCSDGGQKNPLALFISLSPDPDW